MGIFGAADTSGNQATGAPSGGPRYGTGDHGEVWDPNGGPDGQGAWGPNPRNAGGTNTKSIVGPRGEGTMGAGGSYDPQKNLINWGPGAQMGNIYDSDAFGESSGQIVTGPDGKLMVDPSKDGRGLNVARFRGMGEDALKREAPKMDYGRGDVDRAAGQATRDQQGVATSLLGTAARGGAPSGAVIRGQNASDDSFMSALGAQAGARGGAANQAAATRAGANAAMSGQLGVAAHLGGARGAELTSARGAYSAGANTMRQGDYRQQALDQQRQRAGLSNEMGQRELNQNRWKGMEGLAFDTNEAAMNASLHKGDRAAGITETSLARDTREADRMADFYNKSINDAGKMAKQGMDSMSDDKKKPGEA